MISVLLLHSALGRRPAVLRAAERLRAAGHEVVAPDLFDGRTFATPEPGVALAQEIGWSALSERAAAAAPQGPFAVAGLSLGAGLAMTTAVARADDVRGVLLLHAAFPPEGPWPGVPVEAHYAVDDPWVDAGEPEAMVAQVARAGAPVSLHVYPGRGHLFTDEDSPDTDPVSAVLLWERARAFLGRL